MCKRVNGAQTRQTAVCLNSLALILEDEGKFPPAEELARRSLAVRRKLHGDARRVFRQREMPECGE